MAIHLVYQMSTALVRLCNEREDRLGKILFTSMTASLFDLHMRLMDNDLTNVEHQNVCFLMHWKE